MSFEQAVVQLEQTNAALQEEVVRFRDAAMGLNAIYPTITEGRQAVGDGKYFSVPGGGAYMRLYRRQGTSAELIAEFPDRAELNSVIDQLGPLLGRGVVGGSGDLMARGYASLGTTARPMPTGDTLDTLNQFGLFHVAADDPALSITTGIGVVLHLPSNNSSNATQLLFRGAGSRQVFIRDGGSSGYNTFVPIFHSGNFLGPTSFAGGLPSGGIIERGSNANGEYTKFADGTLLMWIARKSISLNSTTVGGVNVITFDYPASIVNNLEAVIIANLDGLTGSWTEAAERGKFILNTRARNSAGGDVLVWRAIDGSTTTSALNIFIQSRWY